MIQEDTRKFKKIQDDTRRYKKIQEDTRRYKKIQEDTRRYEYTTSYNQRRIPLEVKLFLPLPFTCCKIQVGSHCKGQVFKQE